MDFIRICMFLSAMLTVGICKGAEMKKLLLIVADGMRPDAMIQCGHPVAGKLEKHSFYTFEGKTVYPSVTLPCHISLFHSVPPEVHGTKDNNFVRSSIPGAAEVMKKHGKSVMFFYNWAKLRDLARPDSLNRTTFIASHDYGGKDAAKLITDEMLRILKSEQPDFIFLHLDYPDCAGHENYWMTEKYLLAVNDTLEQIDRIIRELPDDYLTVVTADHGGHKGRHGTDMTEDMTIPVFFYHPSFSSQKISGANIIDILPTALTAIGVEPDKSWQGKVLFNITK